MKSEVVLPLRNSFDLREETRKSLLVVTPPMCKLSRAKANLLAASVLVLPFVITFANIGSKSVPTIEPCSIPVSHLASIFVSLSYAIKVPVAGKKSFAGSSAYSLASMDDPVQDISS